MAKCKVVTVCGKRRRLCFVRGKISSNTAASGGGGGAKRRKRSGRKMVRAWGMTAPHARKPCQRQNGQLKKGWHYGKSGRCVKAAA